jgi:hypothetical protein
MTDKKYQHRGWSEFGHWEVNLKYIFRGNYGRKPGNYIYVVRYSRICVYVGMTRGSIYDRLSRHIGERSNLGVAIEADIQKDYLGWSVYVIKVEGELEAAERYYIRKLRPPMNIEENNNCQENVTETVRIFNRRYRPDPYFKYRKRRKR